MKIPSLEDVHLTSVDGVRTVWVDADRPFTGFVIFRVGQLDEELRNRGISHLVEHLALASLRDTELVYNGSVDMHLTTVWAQGEPSRVADFLSGACRFLQDLPVDRLDVERGVLRQESTQRGWNYAGLVSHAYFGPRGAGLLNYREAGLDWLGAGELVEWSQRCFTKENAVLVFTSEPPPGLTVDLPRGEARPLVAPDRKYRPAPQEPTLLETQTQGVTWGALAAKPAGVVELALGISLPILAKRLGDRLRHDLGRVYTVSDWWWRLDNDLLLLFLGVDCLEEHSREVADEFLSVMEQYVKEGPFREELEREARIWEARFADYPDAFLRSLATNEAERILCGWGPPVEPQAMIEEMSEMDPGGIRSRFAEAYRQSYLIADLATGRLAPPTTWRQMNFPADPLPGTVFTLKLDPRRRKAAYALSDEGDAISKVIIGAEGVTFEIIAKRVAGYRPVVSTISVPLEETVLVGFEGRMMLLNSSIGDFAVDTANFRRGDTMEDVCRRELPPEKMLPEPVMGSSSPTVTRDGET